MKFFKVSLSVFIVLSVLSVFTQLSAQSVFVLVHGTWGGGWAFKTVDSIMTSHGNEVYRPTLTGQGERVHLSSPQVGLKTHITDIVNTILYEDLHDVLLVGHSYGGMVITGVADSIPDRISKLIYLDAVVPQNGESLVDVLGQNSMDAFKIANETIIPWWVPEGKMPPKDVPQPVHTWTDKIMLHDPARLKIPTWYILTYEKGKKPDEDEFASQAKRAQGHGWHVRYIHADHNAQWSAPEELSRMLEEVATD